MEWNAHFPSWKLDKTLVELAPCHSFFQSKLGILFFSWRKKREKEHETYTFTDGLLCVEGKIKRGKSDQDEEFKKASKVRWL